MLNCPVSFDPRYLEEWLRTGWARVAETWTYASASTFTVDGDKTALFGVGQKIRLKQTTTKYFSVFGASHSAGTTTVTVTAGTTYSLANAAITEPAVSNDASPAAFPEWFDFAPSPSASVGTYTSVDVRYAKFKLESGKTVPVAIAFSGTTSTTPNYIQFTLPLISASFGQLQASGAFADSNPNEIGILSVQNNSNIALIQLSPSSDNFASGAGQGCIANFWYIAA